MAFQLWIVTEEANGLQWWKTREHAAQRDESSSPDQITDPVLNIVMYHMKRRKKNCLDVELSKGSIHNENKLLTSRQTLFLYSVYKYYGNDKFISLFNCKI